MYEVMVCAGTNSTINPHLIIRGNCSLPKTILVARNCDKIESLKRHNPDDLSAGVVAGMICATAALIMAIAALILWRLDTIII